MKCKWSNRPSRQRQGPRKKSSMGEDKKLNHSQMFVGEESGGDVQAARDRSPDRGGTPYFHWDGNAIWNVAKPTRGPSERRRRRYKTVERSHGKVCSEWVLCSDIPARPETDSLSVGGGLVLQSIQPHKGRLRVGQNLGPRGNPGPRFRNMTFQNCQPRRDE